MELKVDWDIGDKVWVHEDDPECVEVVDFELLFLVRPKDRRKSKYYVGSAYIATSKEELLKHKERNNERD